VVKGLQIELYSNESKDSVKAETHLTAKQATLLTLFTRTPQLKVVILRVFGVKFAYKTVSWKVERALGKTYIGDQLVEKSQCAQRQPSSCAKDIHRKE